MKLFKYIIAIVVSLWIFFLCWMQFSKNSSEAKVRLETDIHTPEGIQVLEEWSINGDNQWVSIRGENKENPMILMVHGGPGSSDLTMARSIDRITEKYFVVVRWDQRNAGKSFHFLKSSGDLKPETFVEDLHDLTLQLKNKFNRKKIYLAGHSWGSIISALAASRYPEDYYAYIGIGQFVNGKENESVSYRFTLEEATKDKNESAIKELTEIGPPPYSGMQELGKVREWLGYYGGALFHGELRKETYKYLGDRMFSSPEYTLLDNVRFFSGVVTSLFKIWPYVDAVDLPTQAKNFQMPVYFLIGRYDYNTPWELSEKYLKVLSAPKKKYIWFENSAHAPNYEEPEKFGNTLRMIREETGN